jgi:hypothetical protein
MRVIDKTADCCTGHDASCNLAKMSFEEVDLDTMAWDKLSYSERDTLNNWIETFRHYKAYPVVGRVVTHAAPYPLPVFTKVHYISMCNIIQQTVISNVLADSYWFICLTLQ